MAIVWYIETLLNGKADRAGQGFVALLLLNADIGQNLGVDL
jgi:hypothetical protein